MSLWAFGFTPHVISAGGRAVHRLHVGFPHVCRFRPSGIEARFPFLFASTTTRCHWNSGEKKIRRMKFSQLKLRKHKIPCDETYWTMQKPCDSLRFCCAWDMTLPMTGPSMSSLQHPTAQGWWESTAKPWQKRLFGRNSFVPSPGLQSFTFEVWGIFRGIHQ